MATMQIEEIKNWQWVLAGLIAGALLSCILVWNGPGFDTQVRDTVEQGEFENRCFALSKVGNIDDVAAATAGYFRQYHKDMPVLRDVTVHPPIASDPKRYWVTGRYYSIGIKPKDPQKPEGPSQIFEEWKLFKYPAPVPYKPGYAIFEERNLARIARWKDTVQVAAVKKAFGGQASYPTVVEYLKAVQALPGSNFKFQFAWWERPIPKWTLPPLAGLLTIGIAWPLTLSAMRNYGLAKPAVVKAKAKPAAVKKPTRQPVNGMPAGVMLKQTAPPTAGACRTQGIRRRILSGGEDYA